MGSWVEGADGSGFGLENLPFGAVARGDGPARPAVRIGEHALILEPLAEAGLLGDLPPGVLAGPVLNPFLALGRAAWSATRARLAELLRAGAPEREAAAAALVPLAGVEVRLPVAIGDYVDFYSSIEHASNVGRIFRPDAEPLLPNWRHLPVGYHGRASSVVVSGTPVRRPQGQLPPAQPGGAPRFGPTERLDIELELGFVTGPGNALGTSIATGDGARARLRLRAGQRLERARHPALGVRRRSARSWASRSPPRSRRGSCRWRRSSRTASRRRAQDPEPLPYLRTDEDWALDIDARDRARPDGGEETVVSRTNAAGLYWTAPQQLAHATVNGTNVRPGDLYAAARSPAPSPDTRGCLLELTWGGRDPLVLAGGEQRTLPRGRRHRDPARQRRAGLARRGARPDPPAGVTAPSRGADVNCSGSETSAPTPGALARGPRAPLGSRARSDPGSDVGEELP